MGLIKGLLIGGIGGYVGVWLAQNYRIPPVESPVDLFGKVKDAVFGADESYQMKKKTSTTTTTEGSAADQAIDIGRAVAWLSALEILFKKQNGKDQDWITWTPARL